MIWYNDIWGVMTYDQLGLFFPTRHMTLDEQLNSVMRFALYFTLIIVVLRRNINALYILVVVGAITYLIYESELRKRKARTDLLHKINVEEAKRPTNKIVYKPTQNNPFMNVMMTDYGTFPNRPPAGDWSDPSVRQQIHSTYNNGVIRETSDIFNKGASDRQYYTMPSTTIPNNQESFAKWLYHNPNTTYKEKRIYTEDT